MRDVHRKREAKAGFEQDAHPWAGEMIRFFYRAKRATNIARKLDRMELAPSLLVKFDRWFDRIIANGEEFYAGLEPFEPARAGKRGPKKRRIAENFLRRLMKRNKETLPFLHDLSVPSRTTRPNGIFG